jgi:hypothetical protein
MLPTGSARIDRADEFSYALFRCGDSELCATVSGAVLLLLHPEELRTRVQRAGLQLAVTTLLLLPASQALLRITARLRDHWVWDPQAGVLVQHDPAVAARVGGRVSFRGYFGRAPVEEEPDTISLMPASLWAMQSDMARLLAVALAAQRCTCYPPRRDALQEGWWATVEVMAETVLTVWGLTVLAQGQPTTCLMRAVDAGERVQDWLFEEEAGQDSIPAALADLGYDEATTREIWVGLESWWNRDLVMSATRRLDRSEAHVSGGEVSPAATPSRVLAADGAGFFTLGLELAADTEEEVHHAACLAAKHNRVWWTSPFRADVPFLEHVQQQRPVELGVGEAPRIAGLRVSLRFISPPRQVRGWEAFRKRKGLVYSPVAVNSALGPLASPLYVVKRDGVTRLGPPYHDEQTRANQTQANRQQLLSETRGKRRSRKHDERAKVGLFELLHKSARGGEKWGVRVAGSESKVVKGERGRQALPPRAIRSGPPRRPPA